MCIHMCMHMCMHLFIHTSIDSRELQRGRTNVGPKTGTSNKFQSKAPQTSSNPRHLKQVPIQGTSNEKIQSKRPDSIRFQGTPAPSDSKAPPTRSNSRDPTRTPPTHGRARYTPTAQCPNHRTRSPHKPSLRARRANSAPTCNPHRATFSPCLFGRLSPNPWRVTSYGHIGDGIIVMAH